MNAKDYTATVLEYANRWKLNIQTVRRFIREGRLHAVKVGRCYFLDPDVIPTSEGHSLDE
nr:MAG: Pyocin activator protein PrtN [Bacteriophage sp.]